MPLLQMSTVFHARLHPFIPRLDNALRFCSYAAKFRFLKAAVQTPAKPFRAQSTGPGGKEVHEDSPSRPVSGGTGGAGGG